MFRPVIIGRTENKIDFMWIIQCRIQTKILIYVHGLLPSTLFYSQNVCTKYITKECSSSKFLVDLGLVTESKFPLDSGVPS